MRGGIPRATRSWLWVSTRRAGLGRGLLVIDEHARLLDDQPLTPDNEVKGQIEEGLPVDRRLPGAMPPRRP